MDLDDLSDTINDLIDASKNVVIELKKKLNICTSKKYYDVLMEKIVLNQENIVYLIDLSKDIEETVDVYSEKDLEEFINDIQMDIDNSI